MFTETAGRVKQVTTEAELDDGGMLTAAVHDRETTLRVRTPGSAPLGAGEPHAELKVTGDDLEVTPTYDPPLKTGD